MIGIVDYGAGNLRSVEKALSYIGYRCEVTDNPVRLLGCDGLILPGVGAFAEAMRRLEGKDLLNPIEEFIDSGRPFLGICLGLQTLMDQSEETFDETELGIGGLGLLRGRVRRFGKGLKVPHMGWNAIELTSNTTPLFEGVASGTYFYFVHSFYADPEDDSVVSCLSEYGHPFCAGVHRANLNAVQFHPEKSGAAGLKVLRNFGEQVLR